MAENEPTLGELMRGINRIETALSQYVLTAVYTVDRQNTDAQIEALTKGLAAERDERQEDKRQAGVWVRTGIAAVISLGLLNAFSIFANLNGS